MYILNSLVKPLLCPVKCLSELNTFIFLIINPVVKNFISFWSWFVFISFSRASKDSVPRLFGTSAANQIVQLSKCLNDWDETVSAFHIYTTDTKLCPQIAECGTFSHNALCGLQNGGQLMSLNSLVHFVWQRQQSWCLLRDKWGFRHYSKT